MRRRDSVHALSFQFSTSTFHLRTATSSYILVFSHVIDAVKITSKNKIFCA